MAILSANALCTRKEVKDYLGTTGSTSTDDALFNALIDRISTAFENYCGRKFLTTTYTEYYDGNGESKLFLDKYPVTAVTSINDDSDWTWGSGTLLDSINYRIADERYIYYSGRFSYPGIQSIKIVYIAGYVSIPNDLKQACIEETARKFKRRRDFDETAKTQSDGSVSFTDLNFLPQTIKTLSYYKFLAVY